MAWWRRDVEGGAAADLEAVRRLADEDVTVFGEQLRALDEEVSPAQLDREVRTDYQEALRAYEAAAEEVPRLRTPDDISRVTDTLATGRYAMACVRARVAGEPPPARRVPCFFNPQHGPSRRDVVWTVPRRGTRRVPACAQCAARVDAREDPALRVVVVGGRRVPYWEAGEAVQPYSRGYFPSALQDPRARPRWTGDPLPGGGLPPGPLDPG